jgi:uncharacterized membrane protein YhaH (DUF805 family)
MKQPVLVARLVFGAWMLANGLNHFFFALWPVPTGHEPLAVQLMDAFIHSGLFNVAMTIELVAGALILAGFFVPVALCVVMPVSTCALYWSAVLEHQALGAFVALIAFALNGLLMLAYIDRYRVLLQKHTTTLFDSLFVSARGRTSREQFVPALITLLAVVAFYAFLVTGRTAQFCLLVLLYPGIVLHARRLHDMGRAAWSLVAPGVLMLAAFAIWLHYISLGAQLDAALPIVALVVTAGFAAWGCVGKSRA